MTMTFALTPVRYRRAPRHVQGGKGSARAWTEADDEILASWWGLEPDEVVADRLNRTVNACKIRATRSLGLARSAQFLTARTVAQIVGVDRHRVLGWIAEGILPAQRSAVGAGARRAWRIDADDLESFLRDYPWRYDRQRMEQGSFYRRIADAAWDRDPWLTIPEVAHALGVSTETIRCHLRRRRLRGVKSPLHGGTGTWLIPRSALAEFQRRRGSALVALGGDP